MEAVSLNGFVVDFASALAEVDARSPVAVSHRSGASYQPGIGPHTEAQTIQMVMRRLAERDAGTYGEYALGVRYPTGRQACDLCLGSPPTWTWAMEVKMLRLMGDNGKPNDNILMHILSPYPAHRSAVTDCTKLAEVRLANRNGIVIYGYDYDGWPMDPAIEAFETLAASRVHLAERCVGHFEGLVHPVHRRGRVFGWELLGSRTA